MRNQSPIKIHTEGKIDIHNREESYKAALAKHKIDNHIIPENKELILTFLRDCQLGKTILGKSKKKIGVARCLKYLGILRQLSQWLGRSFNEITQPEMENFIQKLEKDEILKKSGRPYSEATKVDIKKTIKKFWKWKDGKNKIYPGLVEWIDTYEKVKEIPALTRSEIERMIEYANNPRDKAIIMVLFDSGARVEEILNVRLKKEHLFWKDKFSCFMIRLEFSKTKPRTVSLPLSSGYVKRWLETHPDKDNPLSQLFPMSYPALKMVVYRLGMKALNKRVTPHILRHSSATFYANRLRSPYKLCYRFGWTMASKEVNRYLDREGILEEETAISVIDNEIESAKRKHLQLKEEISIERENHSNLVEQIEKLKQDIDFIRSGKGILSILMALTKKQTPITKILRNSTGERFDTVMPGRQYK